MATSETNLIEELIHNANASGQKPLEQRLADLSIWFYKNNRHIPRDNLAARQAFLEKSMWCMIELTALALERVHELEAGQRGSKHLWLPRGIKMEGDAKEFG